jgi:hypothetical protein
MSEKYSFECVKFYTSWLFLRQVATRHFVSDAKNKQTISKLEKQQTKERKQNTKIYQTWKNNDVFPLTPSDPN